MTPVAADNWRQFAERMAWESHRWRTHARRQLVVETVRDLIKCFIADWGLEMIGGWDGQQVSGRGGKMTERYGRPHLEIAYPGDDFESMLDDRGFQKWRETDQRGSEHIETDFESAVMCCIRAGFDVAIAPSAGVIGSRYTVGMIRRMFPEGLPGYVRAYLDPPDSADQPRFDDLPAGMRVWL